MDADTSTSIEIEQVSTAVLPVAPNTHPKNSSLPRKKRQRRSISLNTRLSVAQSALARLRDHGINVMVEKTSEGIMLKLVGGVTLCEAGMHLIGNKPCPNCARESRE